MSAPQFFTAAADPSRLRPAGKSPCDGTRLSFGAEYWRSSFRESTSASPTPRRARPTPSRHRAQVAGLRAHAALRQGAARRLPRPATTPGACRYRDKARRRSGEIRQLFHVTGEFKLRGAAFSPTPRQTSGMRPDKALFRGPCTGPAPPLGRARWITGSSAPVAGSPTGSKQRQNLSSYLF